MIGIKTLFLMLTLAFYSQSSLQVYMPICAVSQINGLVNYTLANFGHIHYGATIIGQLIIPNDSQYCNNEGSESFANLQDENIKKFVLLKRGSCKFTKKILNAQKKGADLVIIYDNEKSTIPNVVMSNDGHGHLINIPSIFISNMDGQKLIKTYQKCKSTIMKIHFDVYLSKIANVTFWLDLNNRQTFITLRDFSRDYYKVIQKYINYDIKFKINQHCHAIDQCQIDCINNKQYCLSTDKMIQDVQVQGKQLIKQQIRSYYLFEAMKQQNKIANWFQYMANFDKNLCMQKLDIKQCSLNIISSYVKPEQIETKVAETLSNVLQNQTNILSNWVNDAYRSDILFYPQASINNRNFYGLFRAPDIFQMICKSLEKPPSQCHSFIKNQKKQTFGDDESSGMWKTVLLIIFFMIILFFVALFVYNRLIKREINQQMSMEVNKMVQHYVAMTEQKTRSNVSMS